MPASVTSQSSPSAGTPGSPCSMHHSNTSRMRCCHRWSLCQWFLTSSTRRRSTCSSGSWLFLPQLRETRGPEAAGCVPTSSARFISTLRVDIVLAGTGVHSAAYSAIGKTLPRRARCFCSTPAGTPANLLQTLTALVALSTIVAAKSRAP
eukprot:15453959-Alexandrium_andersonii.AAC.1